ncbi:MAG: nitrous oxide-stimulated promoter family protein [Candidatus Bathyarchaeota archaeon]|nr:MAG: nitrous oxide-stimulated promoter family protein [Candidatus Bathyarchaeota archaeon]
MNNEELSQKKHPRIRREKRTMDAMIQLYCKGHHGGKDRFCEECTELLDYAYKRLDRCPFQEKKTTCAKCPIHCYEPKMREKAKKVMRYSGPRMLWHHPIMAVQHLLDGRKKPKPSKKLQE